MDIFVMRQLNLCVGGAGHETSHFVEPSKALLWEFCFKPSDLYH